MNRGAKPEGLATSQLEGSGTMANQKETSTNANFVLLLVILSLSWTASAQERYEFYNGVRALGMGGAGVAVVNDETALLVNPAALGKLRDYFITIADPEIGIGASTEQIAGTDLLNMTDPQEALTKVNENPDKWLHGRAQVFPSIVVPNFGFGVLGKYEINAELDSEEEEFEYNLRNDYAMVFGFNFRFFSGIFKLGANARIVNRVEIDRDDLDPESTTLSLNSLASEGIGVASDVGLIFAAPVAWLPTLAAVYRDVGRTSYTLRDGMFTQASTKPASTPESVDVGLAIYPILGKRTRTTWTVEYRDVLTAGEEEDVMRRLHGGVELNFADALFLRGGWHQRYYTAGLELAIVSYQFQVATYGEDIGTADTPREDRRYVVKFAFRF